MSYLALARKWRPRRFEDVLGQPHVVKALGHALDGDKLHPAILLTGTRGVGKTTLARIIAKSLNCEKGVSASSCGQCEACRQVDEGRFLDLLEIDAASHTGVDNVRDLIDNAQYSPGRGRYKVYLIDEVHMLSKPAFNALLKTLEEPPPHVKFILATTDPQKLPITVLSRCLQFNLRRLPAATIRELLAKVLAEEKIAAEGSALAELSRAADGSMRDGLSLLDQAIAYCGGKELKRAQVEDMLGTQGRQILFRLLLAVAAGDTQTVLDGVEALDAQAPDYAALLNDLAAIVQRAAVLQALPSVAGEDDADVLPLAQKIAAEDLQLYYQVTINGRRDLPWVPDPRLGFEMTLLRMLAFRLGDGGAPEALARGSGPGAAKAAPRTAAATPMATPTPTSTPTPKLADTPAGAEWVARVDSLGLEGFAQQLARHTAWLGRDGVQVRLALDARMKHLLQDDRRLLIEQALSKQLGEGVQLVIAVADNAGQTAARRDEQREIDRQRAAEAAIDTDPIVRTLKEQLGATVRAGSVQPLNGGADS